MHVLDGKTWDAGARNFSGVLILPVLNGNCLGVLFMCTAQSKHEQKPSIILRVAPCPRLRNSRATSLPHNTNVCDIVHRTKTEAVGVHHMYVPKTDQQWKTYGTCAAWVCTPDKPSEVSLPPLVPHEGRSKQCRTVLVLPSGQMWR